MPPIVFLNAAIVLDGGAEAQPVAARGGIQAVVDLRTSQAVGTSPSAAALDALCRRTGGLIVLSGGWGLKDARDALRARGLTAPFHEQFKVDERAQYRVGQIGGSTWTGASAAEVAALPAQHIRFEREKTVSPINRWRSTYAPGAPTIVIDREGVTSDVRNAIVVTVPLGSALGMATVERAIEALAA